VYAVTVADHGRARVLIAGDVVRSTASARRTWPRPAATPSGAAALSAASA
jgi:hypothetical protein